MVIPVPTVLHEGDVKTLPKDVFEHVETMGAPRLVEYWEQDPCYNPRNVEYQMGAAAPPMALAEAKDSSATRGVTIEAKFAVGEYQIVILSAKDSTGLDGWLHDEKYNIPPGAEPLLRPYVESGMKFFVAKVDPQKVKFTGSGADRRAALSPLRFHYDTDQFQLPIRLGLANSSGTQDLIVNILSPNQRYEVANYPNVTIPTNIDVTESVKSKFGAFYTALFDRTVEKHPGAVVTEYAWSAGSCDPCPGPTLNESDFQLLGNDVLDIKTPEQQAARDAANKARDAYTAAMAANVTPDEQQKLVQDWQRLESLAPQPNYGYDLVLTRLHARYGKDIKDDLVFKTAEPIVGGREHVIDQQTGKLEEGAVKDSYNNFQGRYAIRHEWTGPISCMNPHRHRWGGPPSGQQIADNGPQAATNIAFAPRDQVKLGDVVQRDVPEIGVKAKRSGCGCFAGSEADAASGAVLLVFVMFLIRRRR
jgi:MYXO-CTERM domain-containing protein